MLDHINILSNINNSIEANYYVVYSYLCTKLLYIYCKKIILIKKTQSLNFEIQLKKHHQYHHYHHHHHHTHIHHTDHTDNHPHHHHKTHTHHTDHHHHHHHHHFFNTHLSSTYHQPYGHLSAHICDSWIAVIYIYYHAGLSNEPSS